MKLFLQSIAISIGIHLIFFLGTYVTGIIRTMNYTPDFEAAGSFSSEVTFGTTYTASPLLLPITFICVAVIAGAIITLYRSKPAAY
ncbi:hypothetical protein R3398_03145 [Rossellomorea marisflavi]|uniref:hypothetical protein n=1 Tax=Rossellomorea marisflavi TaxID=189381 RepID=UPI0025AFCDAC|nr:hypothetical protein [Rossellomorea marisflavi]MDW4525368.1 hypothetical protein [Rossellomorea marisflavi]WJV18185.1 hypothetical protein QU593_18950 [Rossellomorea marisflavi]